MLIYIVAITIVVIALCLYKTRDDNNATFHYAKASAGAKNAQKSDTLDKKYWTELQKAQKSNGDINKKAAKLEKLMAQKLTVDQKAANAENKSKQQAQKAFDKVDAARKKLEQDTNKAIGTKNNALSKQELTKLTAQQQKIETLQQQAVDAQKKYESTLGQVPKVGQVNSDGTSVWTARGWLDTRYAPSPGAGGAQAGDVNIYSVVQGKNAAIYDGSNWVTINQ